MTKSDIQVFCGENLSLIMYVIVRPDMEEELAVEFVYTLTMFSMMYSIATACPVFLASY